MEKWEEQIDVDDSDLQEILRYQPPSGSSSSQALPLRPCSQIPRSSQTLDSSNFPTLHRQSQLPLPVSETNRNEEEKAGISKETTSRPLIPGPAGAIQAAMRRQAIATATPLYDEEGSDGRLLCLNEEEDGEFKLNPWLCALRFVGKGSDSSISCPISSIKSLRRGAQRIPQVVGIVKSCTPNGFGDLFVMLKDPTGTISAVVYRKASLEEKIGGEISVGCILILQQVVAFSPDRSACYLNITPRNVVKLIMKDCGLPEEHFVHSCAAKYVSDRNAEKPVVTGKSVKKNVDIDAGRNTDGQRKLGIIRQPRPDENFSYNKATAAAAAATASLPSSSQSIVAEPNRLISRASGVQWTDEQLQKLFADYEVDVDADKNTDGQMVLGIGQPCLNENYSWNQSTAATAAAAASMPPLQSRVAEPKMQMSRDSAVPWTDEQLQKLFSDYEDDVELVRLTT